MKIQIFIITSALSGVMYAQTGAVSLALGGNLANPFIETPGNNPAWQGSARFQTGIWGQNRFTGTEIMHGGAFAGWSKSQHQAAFILRNSGTSMYRNVSMEGSVSLALEHDLEVGLAMGYAALFQGADMRNSGLPVAKLGLYGHLHPSVPFGVVISNPWRLESKTVADARADIAIGYAIQKSTNICVQFRTISGEIPLCGISVTHLCADKIRLLGSIQNGPELISGGLEFYHGKTKWILASAYHQYLGFSPSFSFVWFAK